MSVFTNPASGSAENAQAYVTAVLALLGSTDPLRVLQQTEGGLQGILEGLSDEQIVQPEAPGKWSIRHVMQHLADSELVWGYRLRMVLAHDRPPLVGYDQDLWADRLRYNEADARRALGDFGVVRRTNLRLLQGASSADLARVGVHAERGEESIAHMIQLYAGHDLLHLNQLERIRRAVTPET
jgi:uncharacterized damage-inducible protein DinB